jgi:hypothetical protein
VLAAAQGGCVSYSLQHEGQATGVQAAPIAADGGAAALPEGYLLLR